MGPERYRIDDLARLAGTTVRNVRAYQDRGILPPPDKEGRVGWYYPSHLARLRLIGEMLSRGYSLGNISELIEGWAKGQDLSDVLGLERALIAPWSETSPTLYTPDELRQTFEPIGSEYLEAAISTGLITEEGDRYRVADPRLIEGAKVLFEAGVPMDAVVSLGSEIAKATDHIARLYVETITAHLLGEPSRALTAEEIRRLSDVVMRLRPLAKEVVDAALASALERRISDEIGSRFPQGPSVAPRAV